MSVDLEDRLRHALQTKAAQLHPCAEPLALPSRRFPAFQARWVLAAAAVIMAVVIAAAVVTDDSTTVETDPGPPTVEPVPSSTVAPTTVPQTTVPQTTVPQTNAVPSPTPLPPTTLAPVAGIDVGEASVLGLSLFSPLSTDSAVAEISTVLGPSTLDTGWVEMPPEWDCTQNDAYRVVRWGDARFTFERDAEGEQLTAWNLGALAARIAPQGPEPGEIVPSGLTTLEGIGVGSPRSSLDVYEIYADEGTEVAVRAGNTAVGFVLVDGFVTGIGATRLDCSGPNDVP